MDSSILSPQSFRDIEYRLYYRSVDNPLTTFYLPTLAATVQYDRSAGYFRSSALAAAAAGIVRLIANGGRMRLLVGAELGEDDVEAIRQGYDLRDAVERSLIDRLWTPEDGAMRDRLAALTWMVAQGRLDIKVVLPLGGDGYPIPGAAAQEYYHAKKGIFTDAEGNQVGFMGSVNESEQGWKHNFEEFTVTTSWESERDRARLALWRIDFNELWEGSMPGWIAVELPEAVRQELIRRAPALPPTEDPLAPPMISSPPQIGELPARLSFGATEEEQLRFQFLRDAPFLPNAENLAAATSAITLWPHQLQVARNVVRNYPDRQMLCDEVGLGKTIEAGLAVRQLVISRRVRRCLVLAPAAVLKQWQEELYEKFNLHFVRYHEGRYWDVYGQELPAPSDNPWDHCDLLLASSHLARRRNRTDQLADARPWDLLIVDEAHHARRKDFLQPQYRPNRLLTLLNQLKQNRRYQAMLLLTATPMQVHPVEVWDLLTVLGLGGRWGADEQNFLGFFKELRKPAVADVDWDFVYGLVRDYMERDPRDGAVDAHFYAAMYDKLGAVYAPRIRDLPQSTGQCNQIVKQLPPDAHLFVREMARRHTPLRRYISRNTRDLLRKYVERGIIHDNVPTRKPIVRRIEFQPAEQALYERIAEYISDFYRKYEAERAGLGFIMTVYRRRLTSSFYAVRRSLERRRDWLRGQITEEEALTADDELDADDLFDEADSDALASEGAPQTAREKKLFQAELDYLDSFIGELSALSAADSKTAQLKDELAAIFSHQPTVLIFTQYTDTMDYLREQLQTVYHGAVACYSGRGGETWNGIKWVETSKETVKQKFKDGGYKILLCTESASEGLNLQTCGALINYDMPWNPMRVEQRIGRIDRIGQTYPTVRIFNYFYRDTIEDRIYQALQDRIRWFEDVVGALQPILADVNEVTRKLAMLPAHEQQVEFDREMERLRQLVEQAQFESLDLDAYLAPEDPHSGNRSPVTLEELERTLTSARATAALFEPHGEIEGAYWLAWDGSKIAVTFLPKCFDEHPDSVQFLSYGSPLLDALLARVPAPESYPAHLVRLESNGLMPVRAWYNISTGVPVAVGEFCALPAEACPNVVPDAAVQEAAQQEFAAATARLYAEYQARVDQLEQEEASTLRARARRLLEQGSMIEIALGQQQGLFNENGYPRSFSDDAVSKLGRHKKPWDWLLVVGEKPLPQPQESDPYWQAIKSNGQAQLQEEFDKLTRQAKEVVAVWRQRHNM